jgi:hypothetical protein
MEMEMADGVAGVFPDVEDEAITAARDALPLRDPCREGGHRTEQRAVALIEDGGVGKVLLRDHQHVGGGTRREIAERDDFLAFGYHVRRDLPGDDSAKNAVSCAAHRAICRTGSG